MPLLVLTRSSTAFDSVRGVGPIRGGIGVGGVGRFLFFVGASGCGGTNVFRWRGARTFVSC